MKVLTRVNGKHCLLTSEQMDEVLGKCIVCGHVFQPNDNRYSRIVDHCIRFTCGDCVENRKYHVLNLRILQVGTMSGLFWFRLFGRGLHVKDTRRHPPTYSQRTSWLPILTLGLWQVRIL